MADRILLVNAPASLSKERQYAKSKEPRLGLACLAAYLEMRGLQPKVIDSKLEGLDFAAALSRVKDENPDIVGLTALTPEILDAAKLAAQIKSELPQCLIVIGGPHATCTPVQTLEEFPCFDFVVRGEGEITLYELILALRGKKELKEVEGLVFRDHETIQQNEIRPFIQNLDELPPPAWHLFPKATIYPVMPSRGCRFHCNFCARVMGNSLRVKSPQNMVREMETVYNLYHPEEFHFHDEAFTGNMEATHQFLDLLIASGLSKKIRWRAETRVDLVDYELLKKMKQAGCCWVGFGVESGNQAILKATKKGITLDQAEKAVAWAKKAGLMTGSYFILGHPYETKETIKETLDFAAKLNTSTVAFGIMVPYPGTEIASMVEGHEGNYRLLSSRWSDYGKQVGDALELTNISRRTLERLQLLGYIKFYLSHPSFSKLRLLWSIVGYRGLIGYLANFVKRKQHQVE
jgi:anaerobic magnesium-protoporphyrin IX monomethyl ester cyclase